MCVFVSSQEIYYSFSISFYIDYMEKLKAFKEEEQRLTQVLKQREEKEHARDTEILSLKTTKEMLQEKCKHFYQNLYYNIHYWSVYTIVYILIL